MKPTNNSTYPQTRRNIEERINYLIEMIVKLFKNDERFAKAILEGEPNVDVKYIYAKSEIEISKIMFYCDEGHGALVARPNGIFYEHFDNNKADLLIGYENWAIFN